MKHRVNAPLCGKFQAIIDSRHHLSNFKWPMSSGHKLGGRLIKTEVLAF
jgi:hypothetical protein